MGCFLSKPSVEQHHKRTTSHAINDMRDTLRNMSVRAKRGDSVSHDIHKMQRLLVEVEDDPVESDFNLATMLDRMVDELDVIPGLTTQRQYDHRTRRATVRGVAEYFERVYRNLIENSFLHAAGSVQVSSMIHQERITVTVRDNGDGNYTLSDANNGLNEVVALVERMGGQVTLETNNGSCTVVTLPVKVTLPEDCRSPRRAFSTS